LQQKIDENDGRHDYAAKKEKADDALMQFFDSIIDAKE
jgi:hypothetical protein